MRSSGVQSGLRYLSRFWNSLTEPSPALTRPEERRRARLLASALAGLIPINGLMLVALRLLRADALVNLSMISILAILAAYMLTRTAYAAVGAAFALMITIIAPFAAVLIDPAQVHVLVFLANSILFSMLFFSDRVTVVVMVSELLALVALPFVRPQISIVSLVIFVIFVLTGCVLFSIVIRFRRHLQLEREAGIRSVADSELRYRLIAENATDWICRHQLDGTFLYASPACRQLLGYEPETLLGKSPYDYYHPDDIALVRMSYEHVVTSTEPDIAVYRFRRQDGSYIWFETTSRTVRDPQTGTPWEIITVSRDVTERKQVEDVLYASEARFRAAAEGSLDAFYLLQSERDTAGKVVDFVFIDLNKRGEQLVQLPREQIIGQRLGKLFPTNVIDGSIERYIQVVETGVGLEEEYRDTAGTVSGEWLHHQVIPVGDGIAITTRDITERKHAEENLRQINRRLEASRDTVQRVIQQMPIGIQVFDVEGLCTDVNQTYLEIFGVDSREQVIGKFSVLKNINPDRNKIGDAFRRALAGDIVHLGVIELDFDRADRHFTGRIGRLFLSVSFFPIYDENQHIISVVALNQDVTERKRAEEDLRQFNLRLEASRDTLQRVIQQMPIGIQVFSADGLCTDVNQAHMDIFGIAGREQVVGKFNILADQLAETVGTQGGFRRALAGEVVDVGEVEFDFAHADPRFTSLSGRHYLSVSFFPIYDENHTIGSVVAMNLDITERKLSENALQQLAAELMQQKSMLNAIVSATPDQLAIFDRAGRYLYINPPGLATIGVEMPVVQNKTWRELGAPQEMGEKFDRELEQVFTTRQPVTSYNKFPAVYGPRDFEYTLSPVLDQQGEVTLVVSTTRDVTEQRQAEQERFELALQRERVKMLQHLISDTSHDLKTPLATLNTSLYLLKKSISDPARQEHYAEVLQAQVTNLTKILEDMDSMARLDGASEEFVFEPVDLNLLVRQIVTEHDTLASAKNQRLRFEGEPDMPHMLVDSSKLRRAITNLVTNALNYTQEDGTINVRIYERASALVIDVRDNGIGIAAPELALIFDRFYRSEKSRQHYADGSGLGLAISKKIVEAHNGTIEVESTLGVGSAFRIVLPVPKN